MEFKRLTNLKEKINPRKPEGQPVKDEGGKQAGTRARRSKIQKTEENNLTEKLKAAFHEQPKEDPELQRRKELEETMRGFRKSFRQDMSTGVKQQVEGVVTEVKHQVDEVVTEVKHSIAGIKVANKTKKKEGDEEEPSEEF